MASVARRHQQLTAEIARLDAAPGELVTRAARRDSWPSRAWPPRPPPRCSRTPAAAADRDAAQAVTTLYRAHYRSLVKLAALLVHDSATAEEVVQDAFVNLHAAWRRLLDNDHALSYLRRAVARRSRSVRGTA